MPIYEGIFLETLIDSTYKLEVFDHWSLKRMLILISRMEGFDKSLEEASMDLGENSFWTFWRVTFPLYSQG